MQAGAGGDTATPTNGTMKLVTTGAIRPYTAVCSHVASAAEATPTTTRCPLTVAYAGPPESPKHAVGPTLASMLRVVAVKLATATEA